MNIEAVQRFLWMQGDLRYKLDDLQLKMRMQLAHTRPRLAWFKCSRQIGKSYLSCVLALEYLLQCLLYSKRAHTVRILSATLSQTQDIVNDNFSRIMADAPPGLIERSKSDHRWRIGPSTLRLGSLERQHVDKNRGGNADLIIYEETGFVASDDARYAVESVIGPQLTRTHGPEYHISTPSEDEYHYLHTDVGPKASALGALFEYTIYDSPSMTPQMIEAAIARCGGVDTDAFQREYMAKIVRTKSMMMVPEFDDSLVRDFELPEHYEAILMIDGGGVRDKTGIVLAVWDFKEARLLFVNEAEVDRGTGSKEIIAIARQLEAQVKWRSDPNRYADIPGLSQIDFIHEHDYFVRVPDKMDRDANINNYRVAVQNQKVWFHPRCTRLISCHKSARWDKARKDIERTETHGHADILMAGIYAYRMIDKASNPFPTEFADHDSQMVIPYRVKDSGAKELANTLIPFNPMERARSKIRG